MCAKTAWTKSGSAEVRADLARLSEIGRQLSLVGVHRIGDDDDSSIAARRWQHRRLSMAASSPVAPAAEAPDLLGRGSHGMVVRGELVDGRLWHKCLVLEGLGLERHNCPFRLAVRR